MSRPHANGIDMFPSIELHSRQRQIELAGSISSRKKVYLDLRFWIYARNAALEATASDAEKGLLQQLRDGISQGFIVCPISDAVLWEMLKQADTPGRRQGTAAMVDELSLGVSLVPTKTRIANEVANLFFALATDLMLYSPEQVAWTKVTSCWGWAYPNLASTGMNEQDALRLQKLFFDHMWEMKLSDAPELTGLEHEMLFNPSLRAQQVNAVKLRMSESRQNLRSYKQVYRQELGREKENALDDAADIVCDVGGNGSGSIPDRNSSSWNLARNSADRIFELAFSKAGYRKRLRSLHVLASLYAGFCWDKQAIFEANDLFDFDHATAALCYCDAFFTEGHLRNLSSARHTDLLSINSCAVTNSIDEAIAILKSFESSRTA